MDKNIDFKNFINNMSKMGENTFFKELIGLNGSNQFNQSEDIEELSENQMQFLNITTASEGNDNDSNLSLQLLSDHRMETKLTPSLDLSTNVRNLFTFHNKKQLFANNFCVHNQRSQSKENIEVNDSIKVLDDIQISDNNIVRENQKNVWENTLGLSPVKKDFPNLSSVCQSLLSPSKYNSVDNFEDFKGIRINSFSSNDNHFESESFLGDNSFKSLSKCSDLELRPEEPKADINQTFRLPNSDFESKSITSYFNERSEPICSYESVDTSIGFETIGSVKDFSLLNESFASVMEDMNSSDNTLESAQRLIDRRNRKRKSVSMVSLSCVQQNEESFTPSVNSTLNSCEDTTEKQSLDSIRSKSVVTSGLGTMTTLGQTYSVPNSCNTQSIGLSNASTLNLNQLLFVSPNVLSLTIGCFVEFKLNYLKVRNLSITSFRAEVKLQTNVDTLSNLQIEYPRQPIVIPALFDGLLTDQITITPLKSGSFAISFQIYISIESINLPISPMSVICHIRAEELVIKRPLFTSKCLEFNYNLFEGSTETEKINLCISNRQIINEIPLKMCLEPNECITFDAIYRLPNSSIHTFRCPNPNTLFLVTKTQYEIQIPLRIYSNGVSHTKSSLIVSTDSPKSHVLALFRLSATFWSKRELTEACLQCSKTSITLKINEWKEIHFRNKSKDHLIRVCLKCVRTNKPEKCVKLSSSQLMIGPNQKVSIALLAQKKIESDSNTHLLATFDSGFGKSSKISIPIQTID